MRERVQGPRSNHAALETIKADPDLWAAFHEFQDWWKRFRLLRADLSEATAAGDRGRAHAIRYILNGYTQTVRRET